MKLIGDWGQINDDDMYVAFAVAFPSAQHNDNPDLLIMYSPELIRGWAVKRLRQGCYVAIHMPAFSSDEIRQAVGWKPKCASTISSPASPSDTASRGE